jgi:undecaprenyl-diphosphatase
MIRQFDLWITLLVNQHAGFNKQFDFLVVDVLNRTTYNILPIGTLWFAIFFIKPIEKYRKIALEGLIAVFCAIMSSRLIGLLGPHHPRPVWDPATQFRLPTGLGPNQLTRDYSSFPSEHATLAFALAAVIWRASPALGILSTAWAIFIVAFVRLYGGWHYFFDLVGGAVLGTMWVWLLARAPRLTARPVGIMMDASVKYEPIFMAGLFILTFQIVTFFDDIRLLAGAIVGFLAKAVAG